MEKALNYISKILNEQKVINESDTDILKYGLSALLVSIFEITSILILSLFLGNFLNTLVFFVAFVPFRLYAGGYHAETKMKCYLVLLLVYSLFVILSEYYTGIVPITVLEICSIIITTIIVFFKAPIVNVKKKVSKVEYYFYRKRSIIIMIIEFVIILTGILVFPGSITFYSFSLGQLAVSLSMVAAVVINKIKGGESNEKV